MNDVSKEPIDLEAVKIALSHAEEELPRMGESEQVWCTVKGTHLRTLTELAKQYLNEQKPQTDIKTDVVVIEKVEEFPGPAHEVDFGNIDETELVVGDEAISFVESLTDKQKCKVTAHLLNPVIKYSIPLTSSSKPDVDESDITSHGSAVSSSQEHHKLDNDKQVFFYEQDFYVLSNFSSFNLRWKGRTFPTSEHAYHWEKFAQASMGKTYAVAEKILTAPSAHEAFKIAEEAKEYRRPDWDNVKISIMREILREKARQHEYVFRKLLATGDRELIEDSWRDDYWGWGPNRDGQNMLGKLWMEIREQIRSIFPDA